MDLYKRSLYTKPVKYLIHEIFEYDISKANISILLQYGYITLEDYNRYLKMDKRERQISIGYLQKDRRILQGLNDGFAESRRLLMESNNLLDEDILSIKKDAVFTLKRLQNTAFGNVVFNLKNYYSVYIFCKGLEIYFGYNDMNDSFNIDIKGISDDKLNLHEKYLSSISTALYYVASNSIQSAIEYWIGFMNEYNSLPIEYYREFNSRSSFKILNSNYYINDNPLECNRDIIDKSYNTEFNYEFMSILSSMYLK